MVKEFDIGQFVDVLTQQEVMRRVKENFRKRRKECGLTQKELAKRSGVSYASIRRFESTGEISFFSLLQLADTINYLDDFIKLFSDKKNTNLKDLWI